MCAKFHTFATLVPCASARGRFADVQVHLIVYNILYLYTYYLLLLLVIITTAITTADVGERRRRRLVLT